MRNKGAIIVLTAIVSILCIYFLSFSLVSNKIQKDAVRFATTADGVVDFAKKQEYLDSIYNEVVFLGYTYQEIKKHQLKLGLDLQGGMHVTLEVSPADIITALSGDSKDADFREAMKRTKEQKRNSQESFSALFHRNFKEVAPERNLAEIFANLSTKGRIERTSSDSEVLRYIDREIDDAIDRTFQILRARVDRFGVANPNIQRVQGTGRLQVELPGADNPERVRNLLSGVAKLEFMEVVHPQELQNTIIAINDYLVGVEKAEKKSSDNKEEDKAADELLGDGADELLGDDEETLAGEGDTLQASAEEDGDGIEADTTEEMQTSSFVSMAKSIYPLIFAQKDTAKVNRILEDPKVRALIPGNVAFLWEKNADDEGNIELVPVKKARTGQNALTGEVITDARSDVSEKRGEGFVVTMYMNAEGARKWRKMTADAASELPAVQRRIAIVLDGVVFSAPTVQSEIGNGISQITGNFSQDESRDLANVLKAGKLPAPARIVEEGIIGPTLGQEAISQGLISSVAGMVLVVVFMFMYYGKGGAVANLALVFNIFFILGLLAQLSAALTLPGIAGIVLTMGMAVDANVLIFERIREELRSGKKITQAIAEGYRKAFSSIFDANLTTALIGIILFWLGSGPVQGFATTLVIGIFCSFFTAVFVTRVILVWLDKKGKLSESSFDTSISRGLFKTPNFNFIGGRKKAYLFSSAVITVGVVAILVKGLTLGVDFKGGRSYIVSFDSPVVASEIKSHLMGSFDNKGTEVKSFGDNSTVKITTSYLIDEESTDADAKVLSALNAGLTEFGGENPQVLGSSKVGATIADDIKRSSAISIVLSLIAIFIYVFIRFKKWQFSLGGLVALAHDVLIVIAIFGIVELLGFSFEIDQIFIAALLTIIGYSINDTVVVFDRVRENLHLNPKGEMGAVMNKALNDTLSRTVITAVTVLFVAVVLFVFGGEVLRGFSLVLIIGTIFGTYSSLFIATPLVLDLDNKTDVRDSLAKKEAVPTETAKA
ncbi:protein translocase subunit SecDF [Cytophagaceae bacterium ABcell3]|nr:protein translocase subunit SecDF [Cytophagaceae bacterium ABcell3]